MSKCKWMSVTAIAVIMVAAPIGLLSPAVVQAQGPDPATQLYVENIWVGWIFDTGANRLRPYAVVDIVDGNGWPVDGALVVGDWSGLVKERGDSALTETDYYPDGTVFSEGEAKNWAGKTGSGGGKLAYFTFTITGVTKQGMTYVPVAGMTTASAPNQAP